MVCLGTSARGVRCGYLDTNAWCPAHEYQQRLWRQNRWCQADRGDGHPCTRERASESEYCDIARHSNGEECEFLHCNLVAFRRGKCSKHFIPCAGKVFDGRWRRCAAEAVENGYCSWNHDPQFPQLVKPQQLRMNIDRDDVIASRTHRDEYTRAPLYQDVHVDHIVELQVHAHIVNTWWKEDAYYIDEDDTDDLIQSVRTIANKRRNLALTNAATNLLKADGCRRLIQARCYDDTQLTFTGHLVEARSSRFKGSSLDHDDARNIRDAMKLELKRVTWDLDNESDGSSMYENVIEQYRSFRRDLNG